MHTNLIRVLSLDKAHDDNSIYLPRISLKTKARNDMGATVKALYLDHSFLV